MNTEEKIAAFVWVQVALVMLIQVLLVAFVVGFIVGHYFIGSDEVVEVTPNGEEISFGPPPPLEHWAAPNGDQYNHRAADAEIDASDVKELGLAWTLPIAAAPAGGEATAARFAEFASTPVSDGDGVVYLQDVASNVTAVNLETGQRIWEQEYDQPTAGPNGVTYAGEAVYGCAPSFCFSLDAQTGEEIWRSAELVSGEAGAIASPPQLKNGVLYVSTLAAAGGGEAIAIDAANGEEVWRTGNVWRASEADPEATGSGAAAIGPDGTVFIGVGGATTAFEPGGGEILWSAPGRTPAAPVYSEEAGRPLLLDASGSGSVNAQDPASGEQVWEASVGAGGAVSTNMALSEGVAYAAVAGATGGGGVLAALEASNGSVLWEADLPAAPFGAATVSNDLVFTTLENGTALALSRDSGQVLWEVELPGPTLSPLLIEEETVIAVTSGGGQPQVVAYRLGASEEAAEQQAEEREREKREEAEAEGEQRAEEEGEAEAGGEGQAAGGEGEGEGEARGGEEGAEEGGGGAALGEGKDIFTANCGSCHALADAGTTGTVGPDLDQLKPDKARTERQVTNGGAAMPAFAGVLSEAEIEAVSAYVAKAAGGS